MYARTQIIEISLTHQTVSARSLEVEMHFFIDICYETVSAFGSRLYDVCNNVFLEGREISYTPAADRPPARSAKFKYFSGDGILFQRLSRH